MHANIDLVFTGLLLYSTIVHENLNDINIEGYKSWCLDLKSEFYSMVYSVIACIKKMSSSVVKTCA